MNYDAAITEPIHREACDHLLQHVRAGTRQEDLCFGLWRPSTGNERQSALIFEIILPEKDDRALHENASFEPAYLTRAVKLAVSRKAGLAFMHNHFSEGWQDLSDLDVIAERDRISAPARATGLPLVGLTLGTDGAWSARFWIWNGQRFERNWCAKVRVVGKRLRIFYNEELMPPPQRREILRRTVDTWGESRQRDIARMRVGVVGAGSVGCMVAESLARMGVGNMVLIDPDRVEIHNLDRLLYAKVSSVGEYKASLAARHLKRNATAEAFKLDAYPCPIQEKRAYRAALDCDVLFSAVDRPLPKDLVNQIAYSHCIPVISGGVRIESKPTGPLANALWSVNLVGPGRRCLRCDGQYASGEVVMELDGSLDDPAYIRGVGGVRTPANQNVFPFSANVASFMVIEFARLVVAEEWWPQPGSKLEYSMIPARFHYRREHCSEHCTISAKTAFGDHHEYPFLVEGTKNGQFSLNTRVKDLLRSWIAPLLRTLRLTR